MGSTARSLFPYPRCHERSKKEGREQSRLSCLRKQSYIEVLLVPNSEMLALNSEILAMKSEFLTLPR
jgi:hypothetical protein